MLFSIWNDETRTLQVANSGAVQPVLCRSGQSSTVLTEGFPLGLFPNVAYDEFTEKVDPGDAIVLVSDGILDAENAQEEMYGPERLGKMLCGQGGCSAAEIADGILEDVAKFQGGHPRFDDETIIVLRVK
jgi:sigma-B regulation protein RsbU (phosphoserine phosphatase)